MFSRTSNGIQMQQETRLLLFSVVHFGSLGWIVSKRSRKLFSRRCWPFRESSKNIKGGVNQRKSKEEEGNLWNQDNLFWSLVFRLEEHLYIVYGIRQKRLASTSRIQFLEQRGPKSGIFSQESLNMFIEMQCVFGKEILAYGLKKLVRM